MQDPIDAVRTFRSFEFLGMDAVNNAVTPGHATPQQYVKEITMANDGIVNQAAVLAYAKNVYGSQRIRSSLTPSIQTLLKPTTDETMH